METRSCCYLHRWDDPQTSTEITEDSTAETDPGDSELTVINRKA
jgi:hypothetical protein